MKFAIIFVVIVHVSIAEGVAVGFDCKFTNSKNPNDTFNRTFLIDIEKNSIESSFGAMKIEQKKDLKNLIIGNFKSSTVENKFLLDRYTGEAHLMTKMLDTINYIGNCKKKDKLI